MNNNFPLAPALRIAVLASALCSTAAFAGPTNVPFHATLTTQEQLHPDPSTCQSAPYLAGTTSGSGHATHLGAVTGSGTDCITPTSAYTYAFSNGVLTFVAANGDELRAAYQGTLTPSATPPIYTINGTYRFIGGTGRFNNANGSGTIQGLENLSTGQGNFVFDGTISY